MNCRDEQGMWDGGGGGLKFGEKIEDAVVREIKEEYCATPKKIEFLGY
jgi:ADP-ribose pyrophosphatase YjhB (NUDIX family)